MPVASFFYLFEWGLVASLQAYIFAMLSGIYIGCAIEPTALTPTRPSTED